MSILSILRLGAGSRVQPEVRNEPTIDATARPLGLTVTRSESWRQMLLVELAHLDARPRERRGLDA